MVGCLTIETVMQCAHCYLFFDFRGFFDFSPCSIFLRDSSNVPQEWNISQGTQVSLLAILVTSPSTKRAHQVSPCGLGPLLIYKLSLLCGVSVEPAGKIPRSNVSQEQTCRLEQVLTTSVRGMV